MQRTSSWGWSKTEATADPFDANASAEANAFAGKQARILISGPGGLVDADVGFTGFLGTSSSDSAGAALGSPTVPLPVGTAFDFDIILTSDTTADPSEALALLVLDILVDGSSVGSGTAQLFEDLSGVTLTQSGLMAGAFAAPTTATNAFDGKATMSAIVGLPTGFSFIVVPEPGTAALVVLGLTAMASSRRREARCPVR
ncbi:MAG: PEP-CTERM sorting domain-containing protein [Gemmatimonadetes bacterium]|nr:PEP-CTERM sorting domain-containing protein [Gemmatimonadota bacterium]